MGPDARKALIYLIEDHAADVLLVERALKEYQIECDLVRLVDGVEALSVLGKLDSDRLPDLILLDLNLPRVDGMAVLRSLRGDPKLAKVPVVVMSCSHTAQNKLEASTLAASRFITKQAQLKPSMDTIGRTVREVLNPPAVP